MELVIELEKSKRICSTSINMKDLTEYIEKECSEDLALCIQEMHNVADQNVPVWDKMDQIKALLSGLYNRSRLKYQDEKCYPMPFDLNGLQYVIDRWIGQGEEFYKKVNRGVKE